MVAIIHAGKYLHRALNYNEQKVKHGQARCILAENYGKDAAQLNFYQRLHRLTDQAALNTRTTVNSLHVSLNFAVAEKVSDEKLQAIARVYMDKIGFGEQPYLVYTHLDAAHPHVHIVSTNIKRDGKRIALHNIGRMQSETARKVIEKAFGLTAAGQRKDQHQETAPVNAPKIQYSRTATKQAISNVVTKVFNEFAFTSLPEYNAVLGLYNMRASRGEPGSRTYERNGLLYQVLHENGKPAGMPIKASLLHVKPTLQQLEKKFKVNEEKRIPFAQRIRSAIDWTLARRKPSLEQFCKKLEQDQVHVVMRKNIEGQVYGITYVDLKNKCVFNGSELGRGYAAKAIQEKCAQPQKLVQQQKGFIQDNATADFFCPTCGLADGLQPQAWGDTMPAALRGVKRKKRRRKRL